MPDASVVGSVLTASALTGVAVAIVNGIFTKRRVGAEATEIITKAAGGMVDRLNEDNRVKGERITACENEISGLKGRLAREEAARERDKRAWERERVAWRHILEVHATWDFLALERLEQTGPHAGPPLPPVPPLTPHTRASDYPDHEDDEPR